MVDETYTRHIRRLEATIAALTTRVATLEATPTSTVATSGNFYLRGEEPTGEHIVTSSGAADAGKPVITTVRGLLHPSLLSTTTSSTFVYQVYQGVA